MEYMNEEGYKSIGQADISSYLLLLLLLTLNILIIIRICYDNIGVCVEQKHMLTLWYNG